MTVMPPRLGVEMERDGENRWTSDSRLGRTLVEQTRNVNGFIFSTEGFTGNNRQVDLVVVVPGGISEVT